METGKMAVLEEVLDKEMGKKVARELYRLPEDLCARWLVQCSFSTRSRIEANQNILRKRSQRNKEFAQALFDYLGEDLQYVVKVYYAGVANNLVSFREELVRLTEALRIAKRWYILYRHDWPIDQLPIISKIIDLLKGSERTTFWFHYLLGVDIRNIAKQIEKTEYETKRLLKKAIKKVMSSYSLTDEGFFIEKIISPSVWLSNRSGQKVETIEEIAHAEAILESFSTETSGKIRATYEAKTYSEAATIIGCTDKMIEGAVNRAAKLSKTWWRMATLGWTPEECKEAMFLLKHLVLDERIILGAYWLDGKTDFSDREEARLANCLKFASLKYELKPFKPLKLKKETTIISPRIEAKLIRQTYQKLIALADNEGRITGNLKDIAPIVFPEVTHKKALRNLYHAHRWLILARWIEYDRTIDNTDTFFVLDQDRPDINPSQKENAKAGGLFVSYWEILDEMILQLRDRISCENDLFPASLRELSRQALLAKLPPECKVSPERIQRFAISASFYFRRKKIFLRNPGSQENNSTYRLGEKAIEVYRRLCN